FDQVVLRVVDAADEGAACVDDDELVVHAAEHVDAGAEQAPGGLEAAQVHTGVQHGLCEGQGNIGRAPSIDQHMRLDATPGCGDQRVAQRLAHLVVKPDEGL